MQFPGLANMWKESRRAGPKESLNRRDSFLPSFVFPFQRGRFSPFGATFHGAAAADRKDINYFYPSAQWISYLVLSTFSAAGTAERGRALALDERRTTTGLNNDYDSVKLQGTRENWKS